MNKYSFFMNMFFMNKYSTSPQIFSQSLLISEGSEEVTITFFEGRHSY